MAVGLLVCHYLKICYDKSRVMLCNVNVDFLLDIMNRQGAHQSMAWLGPIIASEPDTLDVLPITCLSELLLNLLGQSNAKVGQTANNEALSQLPRLLARLTQYLGSGSSPTATMEVLDFFLARLSNRYIINVVYRCSNVLYDSKLTLRDGSKKALNMLLANSSTPNAMDTNQTVNDQGDY